MRSPSFRTFVTALMVALITVTVAVLLMIAGHFQRRSIMTLVDDVADQTLGRVELRVQRVLDQARILNHQALRLLIANTNAPPARERLGDFLAKSLEVLDGIAYAGLGFEDTGDYIMARRMPEGAIQIREFVTAPDARRVIRTWRWTGSGREALGTEPSDGYDPRQRPFYQLARAQGRSAWTETYPFWNLAGEDPVLGVSYATPWHDADGRLLGVLDTDFDLRSMCGFLGELEADLPGYALIAERRTNRHPRLIAHPRPECILTPGSTQPAESLEAIQDRVVLAYFSSLLEDRPDLEQQEIGRRFQVDGRFYLGSFRRLTGQDDPPWTIAMIIPREQVLGGIRQNALWGLAGAGCCLAGALVAVFWLARHIARPLQNLSRQAKSIGDLNFDTTVIRRSPIREVRQLESSMAEMKTSLRSFRKYVPADLVHQLLATGEEARLGGRQAELTIFFSDITGFTAISESLPPPQLVELMGEYLAAISEVIHQHRGTVDKFIGDGVMAFWGAPQANPNHAADACRAAWYFQERLELLGPQWLASGRPRLPTRIGIHTGEAIVGNFGSESRINYTVIGDAVNLASRLEGLNRHFGTRILLSESTRAAAGAAIIARPVSRVVLPGKANGVLVYEMLDLADAPRPRSAPQADRSTEAFAAFEQRDFPRARQLYQVLLQDDPKDGVARVQLQRCEELMSAAWNSDTDTVHRMKTK